MRTPALAKLLLAVAVLGFAGVVVRDVLGVESVLTVVSDWSYNFTQVAALAACVLCALRTAGYERAAWAAFSAGLGGYLGGDLYYSFVLSGMESPPFPSPADAGYLSIYPAAYVGLVLLLRARAGRIPSNLWIDGVICALAASAIGAGLVLGIVATTSGSFATVATNLAYPLGDVALLAFVGTVIVVAGRRAGRTWFLVAAGFGVFALGDTIYLVQTALGTYVEHRPLDAAWPAAYVLLAFAAWQPRERLDSRRLRNAGMLALPVGAALLSLGVLVFDHYVRLHIFAIWLASASLVVVVVRLWRTFRDNLRMLRASEEEATTDPLTGLGNRRALAEDLERAVQDGVPHALALFDLDGFKSYNDAFGHPAGDALLERLGRNLTEHLGGAGSAYRMGGDEFCLLAPIGDAEPDEIARRGAEALTERGRSFHVGCSYGVVTLNADHRDPVDALRRADQLMYAHKRTGRRSPAESIHQVLMSVVGEHDGSLRDHVDSVTELAERVGRRLGLDPDELAHIRRAASLHDIGKVAIPDAILHAPRKLTPEEWEYMHQHTVIGARIISAAPEMLPVAEIVRSSHERWDGGGYPDRLAGDAIPLGARIVAVCDSFEAMTADRAYRRAMSQADALAEVRRCAGTQFDPRVAAAFEAVLAADTRVPALAA
jgi:diguanylate cyclase (GGDEF)-like protein/putative nucleotidyltransferase with HDIG domain